MRLVKVSLPVVLEVSEENANEILNGDITSLLKTIYTPDRHSENRGNGKWWVEGNCLVENGKIIKVCE